MGVKSMEEPYSLAFVVLQVAQGQSEWKDILCIMSHSIGRSGCSGDEIKWESIVSHGLMVALSLHLGKYKVVGSESSRTKLRQRPRTGELSMWEQ